jgi:hypothetical protein
MSGPHELEQFGEADDIGGGVVSGHLTSLSQLCAAGSARLERIAQNPAFVLCLLGTFTDYE